MDFTLSKEHQMMQTLFRDFAEKECAPVAQELDEQERFPTEAIEKAGKYGFMGIFVPREYGGQGCDTLAYSICIEEISKACAATGDTISAHASLCAAPIMNFGTEEQKQKFLVPLAKGEKLGAFGLTEPNAGTDAAGQQTKAVLEGDNYVLNGSKIFITNAGEADTYVIFAMTDKSQGTRGISAFIVEKGTPGFSFGTMEHKLGIRASCTGELVFENCVIPKENLLGKEGEGFKIAMKTLDGGRIGIASQALGIAEGAFDKVIPYVKERKQFGKTLAQFQNSQFVIADMKTQIDAAQLLTYKAAYTKDIGGNYGPAAAMAKLFAAETAMFVTRKVVQLFGGYGYIRDYEVERMYRDAKITEIYEGTSEVQRMVISSSLLR